MNCFAYWQRCQAWHAKRSWLKQALRSYLASMPHFHLHSPFTLAFSTRLKLLHCKFLERMVVLGLLAQQCSIWIYSAHQKLSGVLRRRLVGSRA